MGFDKEQNELPSIEVLMAKINQLEQKLEIPAKLTPLRHGKLTP